MSDSIKHECGIALVRLLKPLDYYAQNYDTPLYGLNKLYLLMQKQHNRGQDGAGVINVKLDPVPGKRYISRYRSINNRPLQDIFSKIHSRFKNVDPKKMRDGSYLKKNFAFCGELYMGHLRYGTHGKNSKEACHPVMRQNNWMTRTLAMAGNFNLTNVDELFEVLIRLGQHPKEKSDTVTVLEKVGHFLDHEVQRLYDYIKAGNSNLSNEVITAQIIEELDIANLLQRAAKDFDGGYAMGGVMGHGDAFVLRDPNGIRPAFYYADEDVVVVASERPAIQTAFQKRFDEVKEIPPGHAIIIKKGGKVSIEQILKPKAKRACSFERIYFSRGTDTEIYSERKKLGAMLARPIMELLDNDVENTVFSFIPNTAQTAFIGMTEELRKVMDDIKAKALRAKGSDLSDYELKKLLALRPRVDSMVVKDAKLRTFITDDSSRKDLVNHVYDVTYGVVKRGVDNLVLIDDSIVRGTTLKESIIRIVSRLQPKRIVIVSSAPQIRYPDCYGIDMSKLKDFIAFRAAENLTIRAGREDLLDEIYDRCKAQLELPMAEMKNEVVRLYDQFTDIEISDEIARMISPTDSDIPVSVIYQTIEDLHRACPQNSGDWYFSGRYPTPGGNRVVNRAYVNYREKKNVRAY